MGTRRRNRVWRVVAALGSSSLAMMGVAICSTPETAAASTTASVGVSATQIDIGAISSKTGRVHPADLQFLRAGAGKEVRDGVRHG